MKRPGIASLALVAIAFASSCDERPSRPIDSAPAAAEPAESVPMTELIAATRQPGTGVGTVIGRVTDPLGSPIAGCEVLLLPAVAITLEPVDAEILGRSRTDADGRFHVSGGAGEERRMVILHAAFPPCTVALPAADPCALGDVRLASALGCEVVVRGQLDDETSAIDGATVVLRPELVAAELPSVAGHSVLERVEDTNARGEVVLYGIEPGSYRLRVSAPTQPNRVTREQEYVKPEAGPPRHLEIELPAGYPLTGRVVTDTDESIPNAEVAVAASAYRPAERGRPARTYRPELTTRTNEQGVFRFNGLDGGTVRLRVDAPDRAPAEIEVTVPTSATVKVKLAPPTTNAGRSSVATASERHAPALIGPVPASQDPRDGQNIAPAPAAVVTGRVLDPSGGPLKDASIEVMDPAYDGSEWAELLRGAVRDPSRPSPARSDELGEFRAVVDTAGASRIRLRVSSPKYPTLLTEPFEMPPEASLFAVGDLQTPFGYRLTGRAVDGDGRPVNGAIVCATPIALGESTVPLETLRAATDGTGSFSLEPLAEGVYDVFYYGPSMGNAAAAADRHATTRRRIRIPADAHAHLELAPR